ncbi:thiamine pyrophosphate-binding protein [Opitutaceae bacterium]|nr:thiamine pyrophosphate-binding protein [Opitutaceae bacterium]
MSKTTIPDHLIRRFREVAVEQAFGIVGDFALRLFSELSNRGFSVLVTTDEQGAGFAADAYARIRGFGVVATTFGVGGLKVANAAANAWAERVPLLILSGAPGVVERKGEPMLHHRVKDFDTQLRVFTDLTCAQAVLNSPHNAASEIDRVIQTMISTQRPGYIEVPRDAVTWEIDTSAENIDPDLPPVDAEAQREAIEAVLTQLRGSDSAAIHAGASVERRDLGSALFDLATSLGIPVATSSLARGCFPERHELGLGVYLGALSPDDVVQRIEGADVLLSLGVLQTDLTLGAFTANIDHHRLILATDTEVTVGYCTFKDVPLWSFLPALVEASKTESFTITHDPITPHDKFVPTNAPNSVERTIAALESHIDSRHSLLLDPGEALFSSVDMRVPTYAHASAYYATMGYAVPAALGAGIADPNRRPVVVVGDGAFAMTGLEVAACAFHHVNAIFVVLDNSGYGTQRPILDGPFNDIPSLAVENLPSLIETGLGWKVTTESELDQALSTAVASDHVSVVRVMLSKHARSPALSRLGAALAAKA